VPDLKTQKPIIQESKISHAMYINKLLDVSWLENLKGIISADVCAGPRVDSSLLQHVDYFFIADEDAYADLTTMCKDTKGYVVLHTNKSSVVSDGRYETKHQIDDSMFVQKSNVLGAGDMFASSFLHGLHLGLQIDDIQKYAHETTSKLIKSANEKI
jgi:sugar/nucleoside kinase (ribokinase family)